MQSRYSPYDEPGFLAAVYIWLKTERSIEAFDRSLPGREHPSTGAWFPDDRYVSSRFARLANDHAMSALKRLSVTPKVDADARTYVRSMSHAKQEGLIPQLEEAYPTTLAAIAFSPLAP